MSATTELIIVYGNPSTGKTTSFFEDPEAGIVGLPPEKLFVINCAGSGKKVPVPDKWIKNFQHSKEVTKKENHLYIAPTLTHAKSALDVVLKDRTDINYILLDDVTIGASRRVTGSENKLDFEDWRKIGVEIQFLMNSAMTLTNRTVFVFMVFHSQREGVNQDRTRVRTPGTLVDNYMGGIEGQVSTVLESFTMPRIDDPDEVDYFFRTRSTTGTARSLRNMFPPILPNDMGNVVKLYCQHQKIMIP